MNAPNPLFADLSFLENLPPPFNMIVYVVLIICATSVLCAITGECRKYFAHREEIAFKRELIDRGLSVEEVERVVRTSSQSYEEPLS